MYPATAWDDSDWDGIQARGWTVMRRLRERERPRRIEIENADRRIAARERAHPDPRPDLIERQREDSIIASWSGCPTVLAFLFTFPDSDAMAMLDVRGEYFDLRTGDTWDLFFPGYYRSTKGRSSESSAGAHPIGRDFGGDWYFSARDFNELRRHIENSSEHRWEYSGGVDLVLINAWLEPRGDPTIDWASTISGQVSDRAAGIQTLTLGNVIERITGDLKNDTEDSSYNMRKVTDGQPSSASHMGRDFMIQALSGIAAALGMKRLDS
jgi:hypothetical protein